VLFLLIWVAIVLFFTTKGTIGLFLNVKPQPADTKL